MRGLTHSETDKDWGFITSWALLQKKHPDKPSPFLWATHQQHPTMHCGWENGVMWLDNIQAARGGVIIQEVETQIIKAERQWPWYVIKSDFECLKGNSQQMRCYQCFSLSVWHRGQLRRQVSLLFNYCTLQAFSQAQGKLHTHFFTVVDTLGHQRGRWMHYLSEP